MVRKQLSVSVLELPSCQIYMEQLIVNVKHKVIAFRLNVEQGLFYRLYWMQVKSINKTYIDINIKEGTKNNNVHTDCLTENTLVT